MMRVAGNVLEILDVDNVAGRPCTVFGSDDKTLVGAKTGMFGPRMFAVLTRTPMPCVGSRVFVNWMGRT